MVHTEVFMVWEDIEGYTGYMVSSNGDVLSRKRVKERYLKPDTSRDGYYKVTLSEGGITRRLFVHRLVAEAFITNDDTTKIMVNHKDGNKKNNSVDNLEWVTCSENTIHAFDNNLRVHGENAPNAQLTDQVVHKICELIEYWWTRGEVLGLKLHPKLTKSKFDDIRSRKCWKRISNTYQW